MLLYMQLVMLLMCPCAQSINEAQKVLMEKLGPSLEFLCRGVDICGNTSEPARNDIFDEIYTSCCKGCSCSDNCKRGTCCFGESDIDQDTSLGKCQHPVTFEGESPYPVQRYYITETEPDNGCVDELGSCYVSRPYKWGNVWPVTSNKTNRIYKTPRCAECYGLSRDEYIPWGAEYICDNEPLDSGLYYEFFDKFIRTGIMPQGCIMLFINIGKNFIGNEKCFDQEERECKDNFLIPEELNMTRADIVDACLNGPRIPATIGKSLTTFYNPYCYICLGGFPQHLTCETDNTVIKNSGHGRFTALISAEKIEKLTKEETRLPQACESTKSKRKEESSCRDVLCPSGQIRDSSGSCGHTTDRWLNVNYVVLLDFHISQNLSITPLIYITILEELIKSLKTPVTWRKNAYFHVFPCKDLYPAYDEFTISFVVDNREPLKEVLFFLDRILQRQHNVLLNGNRVTFDLSINKFYLFKKISRGGSVLTPDIPSFDSVNVTTMCYDMVRLNGAGDLSEFSITKMFFCEQVILLPHEYRLNYTKYSRALEYNGRVLYLGEFLFETTDNGDTLVKVCLGDTDFRKVRETWPMNCCETLGSRAFLMVVVLRIAIILFALHKTFILRYH